MYRSLIATTLALAFSAVLPFPAKAAGKESDAESCERYLTEIRQLVQAGAITTDQLKQLTDVEINPEPWKKAAQLPFKQHILRLALNPMTNTGVFRAVMNSLNIDPKLFELVARGIDATFQLAADAALAGSVAKDLTVEQTKIIQKLNLRLKTYAAVHPSDRYSGRFVETARQIRGLMDKKASLQELAEQMESIFTDFRSLKGPYAEPQTWLNHLGRASSLGDSTSRVMTELQLFRWWIVRISRAELDNPFEEVINNIPDEPLFPGDLRDFVGMTIHSMMENFDLIFGIPLGRLTINEQETLKHLLREADALMKELEKAGSR